MLWDAILRRSVAEFGGEGAVAAYLAWSPDGRLLATGARDGVQTWDGRQGSLRARLLGAAGPVAWSPDGRTLAAVLKQEGRPGVLIWNSPSCARRELPASPREAQHRSEARFAWSPDGRLLAITETDRGASDGSLSGLWDAASWRRVAPLPGSRAPVAWDRAGQTLATGADEVESLLWDGSGQLLGRAGTRDLYTTDLAWSPGGRYLAAHTRPDDRMEGYVTVWDAHRRQKPEPILVQNGAGMTWQPDGQRLLVDLMDWTSLPGLRDPGVGRKLQRAGRPYAWRPDEGLLAAADVAPRTGRVQFWNVPHRRQTGSAAGPGRFITALAWRPDGKVLAIAATDLEDAWRETLRP